MVISIDPHGRDDKFHDIATLTLNHSRGKIDAPNRVVDRHDYNAKQAIGTEIPLTRRSKSFVFQEIIDPEKLDSILNKNGYLKEMIGHVHETTKRLDPETCIFLYPSLTEDSQNFLNKISRNSEYIKFFCDVAKNLKLESIVLEPIKSLENTYDVVKKQDLQLIPILNLKVKTEIITNQFEYCRSASAQNIPIIGFKFATYPSANKAYDYITPKLDKIHEDGQATMMVDIPRSTSSVSAHHYAPFFMIDIVAGKYYGGGGNSDEDEGEKERKIKLFCRKDLAVPEIESPRTIKTKFEIDSEIEVFSSDKKLQELLTRMSRHETTEEDWKQNRPIYLSRLHENVRSREEFAIMQKKIESNSTSDYLLEKHDMSRIIKEHLKHKTSSHKLDEFR